MNLACLFNRQCARQYLHTLLLACVLSGAVTTDASAALRKVGDEGRLKINISGTVVATGKCTFRNRVSPDINFGDIRFSSVSGVNNISGSYVRPLDTDMTCTGDTAGGTRFRFDSKQGAEVSDGSHKLLPVRVGGVAATNPNLGIRLLVNGKPQDINTDFYVDLVNVQNLPKLEVELVQLHPDDNTWVNGQSISSSAVLTMSFD